MSRAFACALLIGAAALPACSGADAGAGNRGGPATGDAAEPPTVDRSGEGGARGSGDASAGVGAIGDDGSIGSGDGSAMGPLGSDGGGGSLEGGPTCGGGVFGGGPITTTTMHLDIGVHDPSMIWDGQRYYLFATNTLAYRSSADMLTWSNAGMWLGAVPAWVTAATTATSLWAPDISYFNGRFHVYYAGSTSGSNTSVIGLATTTTLASPSWTDQGLIVQSKSTDDFNAIDPNVTFDSSCTPWLAFGSFWSGIKMRKLDATTGKLATDDATQYSLAARPKNGGAIEASSVVSHNGYYYLFVSFDACCKGVSSTYNTNVGRATQVTGPYSNKAGTDMMAGGAELLLSSAGRYIGPGGGTAWKDGDHYLYAYHYYDGQANGAPKLQVRPINFDADDWVTLGDPLFP